MLLKHANILYQKTLIRQTHKIYAYRKEKNIKATSTETLKIRLKKKENFSIKWLKTLATIGLNQELN